MENINTKKALLFLLLFTVTTCINSYSQGGSCFDSLKTKVTDITCFGSNDGVIEISYYPTGLPSYITRTLYFGTTVVQTATSSGSNSAIVARDLKPGGYNYDIYQYDGNMNYICHTNGVVVVKEPPCDLNIDNFTINTDTESPGFLTYKAKIDGHFCAFGYENQRGLIFNGKDTLRETLAPLFYQDSVFSGDPLTPYVLPGDEVQFYIDNANESPQNSPSSTCRTYSEKISIECDLAIGDLTAYKYGCDRVEIRGKLMTKYLKLLANTYALSTYANRFFAFDIIDSENNVLASHIVNDTSGLFTIRSTGTIFSGGSYKIRWKLGRCSLDFPFSFTQSTASVWAGGSSNEWNNPNNWLCGAVPGANADVVINQGTVVLSANTSVKSLTLNAKASLVVAEGYELRVGE